ncbi:putative phosphoglycerate/bisphosphoglycerate mutase [Microlunatus endophyticus]|uniref:Phosphoglycerate/bisphosphoglycerate mutase n=1 Tax=Microlunatus endophyticus TaxID=1716077 RepID=A0A917VZT6_9ACTN|nr:MSMEG_4193 family putative phosphomutase [Microlunatus endophyticus]GGL49344.1 putative phosphoglycerate/bisphosphoglycerate mutase [Microlunatus endophyticus]
MTTVLLLRHGRTNANLTGVLAGRSPGVELDDVGVRQAAAAAERIAPLPVRAVVSSPLRRCRQTAKAVVDARVAQLASTDGGPVPVQTEAGLIECGYGSWTGRKLAELSKEKLWAAVQQQPSAVRFPEGESMAEMSARATATIRNWDQKIAAEHGDSALWVAVSHGDVIKAILADALGMHLDQFQRIMVDPASISVVHFAATRPFVLRMNTVGQDLESLIPKPAPAKRAAKKSATKQSATRKPAAGSPADAAIGGGLGTDDLV